MLSRKIPKLKLWSRLGLKSKGGSNTKQHSISRKLLNKYLLSGIPVLSIFALIGIIINAVMLLNSSSTAEAVYAAEEVIGDSTASITISGAGREEVVSAGRGSTIYRTHSISITGSNVRNYTLSIYGDSNLKYVGSGSGTSGSSNDILTSANGVTGTTMNDSTTYDNTWGYGYGDSTTSNDNLTYKAPTGSTIGTAEALASGTVASSANGVLSISNKKLVFAAKFGEDKPRGNYRANVNLALTITPRVLTTYSITYSGNGNTGGSVPTKQSIDLYDTTSYNGFIAAANTGNLTKTGYNFLGWAESSSATAAQYTVGATVSLTQASPNKTLYAVWEKRVLTLKDITKMQEMTADICEASAIGDTNTLTDARDNNTYTIRKHEDNNCWMTQNLRIVGSRTLTSSDSNVDSNFSLPASNISSFTNDQSINSVYYGGNISYGAYYSWNTATAGTRGVSYSVCPKGWRLPANTAYSNLITAVNAGTSADASSTFRGNIYQFTLAGHISGGYISESTVYGDYWTSTDYNGSRARQFRISTSAISAGSNNSNYYRGLSVRCVAYSS